MAGISDLFNLVATVDRLLKLEAKQTAAIDEIKSRPFDLDRRVTRLEAREEILVAEARAGAAASQVTMMAVADMARRIGGLEAQSTARLLPPGKVARTPRAQATGGTKTGTPCLP